MDSIMEAPDIISPLVTICNQGWALGKELCSMVCFMGFGTAQNEICVIAVTSVYRLGNQVNKVVVF